MFGLTEVSLQREGDGGSREVSCFQNPDFNHITFLRFFEILVGQQLSVVGPILTALSLFDVSLFRVFHQLLCLIGYNSGRTTAIIQVSYVNSGTSRSFDFRAISVLLVCQSNLSDLNLSDHNLYTFNNVHCHQHNNKVMQL